MREFTLTEVLTMDRAAFYEGAHGGVLHFRPEQQVAAKDPIIEVSWPSESQGGSRRFVEVIHTRSGYLVGKAGKYPPERLPATRDVPPAARPRCRLDTRSRLPLRGLL